MQRIDQQIIRLVRQGYTYREVSETLKVTRGKVAGVCYREGVKRPQATVRKERSPLTNLAIYKERMKGIEPVKLAKKYGVTRNAVCGIAFRHCDAIESDNRDLEICKRLDAGVDIEEICREFSVQQKHLTGLIRGLEQA